MPVLAQTLTVQPTSCLIPDQTCKLDHHVMSGRQSHVHHPLPYTMSDQEVTYFSFMALVAILTFLSLSLLFYRTPRK